MRRTGHAVSQAGCGGMAGCSGLVPCTRGEPFVFSANQARITLSRARGRRTRPRSSGFLYTREPASDRRPGRIARTRNSGPIFGGQSGGFFSPTQHACPRKPCPRCYGIRSWGLSQSFPMPSPAVLSLSLSLSLLLSMNLSSVPDGACRPKAPRCPLCPSLACGLFRPGYPPFRAVLRICARGRNRLG